MNVTDDRFFFDTNVLIYWLDEAEGKKYESARRWVAAVWEGRCGAISWQVLNEFYANATRKAGMRRSSVRSLVEDYSEWNPIPFTLPLLKRAWHWCDRAGVPYWDALILAAAETAGCSYVLTEDFQAGQRFGDLTIVNPCVSRPGEFGLE